MIVSCPSCKTRFLFKRSAFSRATKRQGKCIKCGTLFIIGPLPPFTHNPRAEDPKPQESAHEQPVSKRAMTETWSSKSKRRAVGVFATLLALALLLAGGYFHNSSTVKTNEKPSPSLPGLENTAVLEIKNLELGWKTNENITQLSVQGELSNPSSRAVESAGLTITLLDENDMPVLLWDYRIPPQVIGPGQHIKFETSTDNPPLDAISATVRLK